VSHRREATQIFRDVEYREAGVVVALDGRLFHSSVAKRDADMHRDLDAASGWVGTPHSCAECG